MMSSKFGDAVSHFKLKATTSRLGAIRPLDTKQKRTTTWVLPVDGRIGNDLDAIIEEQIKAFKPTWLTEVLPIRKVK
jgi:hypothetical protein